jgi:hypothetical protein
MSTKITITRDECGVVDELSATFDSSDVTWTTLLEKTLDMFKGLTYITPDTDELMGVIEDYTEEWINRDEIL